MRLNKEILIKVIEKLDQLDSDWLDLRQYLGELYPPEKFFTAEYKYYRKVWDYYSSIGLNIWLLQKLFKELKESE